MKEVYLKVLIREHEREIETLQDSINKNYESLTRRYFELRRIIEDERNHEDKLICKPLKPEKLREYKTILNIYKENCVLFKRQDEDNNTIINGIFEKITKLKKDILTLQNKNEIARTSEQFENKRRENLTKIIGFLKDKDQYKAQFQLVEDILNKKQTSKK